jgi:hypothetical protein
MTQYMKGILNPFKAPGDRTSGSKSTLEMMIFKELEGESDSAVIGGVIPPRGQEITWLLPQITKGWETRLSHCCSFGEESEKG